MKKGLNNNWIEIFSGGKQTDSAGVEHDGDALIDKAVAGFDPKFHEPPVCVGHPTHDAPAFGWIKDLKSEAGKTGKILLAKLGDVQPAFEEAVRSGLYKKRSAAFYPDGKIRHLAFLGGAPPAVKGLADIQFKADETFSSFEFTGTAPWTWGTLKSLFRSIREWIIEKDGKDAADAVVPEYYIRDIEDEEDRQVHTPPEGEDDMANFTEAQVREQVEAAKAQAKRDALEEMNREKAVRETGEFCDRLVSDGKLMPAKAGDLKIFMMALPTGADEGLTFAEGGKKSPLEFCKEFVSGILEDAQEPGMFTEQATRDRAAGNHKPDDGTDTTGLTKLM